MEGGAPFLFLFFSQVVEAAVSGATIESTPHDFDLPKAGLHISFQVCLWEHLNSESLKGIFLGSASLPSVREIMLGHSLSLCPI